MSRLMSKLAALTSPDWVLRVLTLYADDFLLQCEGQNEHDLWDHLHFVGILFELLEQAGLTMNLSKTVALFQLQGRKMRKIQSRVLVKSDNQWHLPIPRSHGRATRVKLVEDVKYLGIKLSYLHYARLTVEHRLAAGKQANRRLHRWLYGKKGLDLSQRRRLWESVVRTTLLYGIWATGTTPAGLKHLIMQMVTMQRMIYKNHSYRTKDSHEAFFHDRQLEPPHLFLHRCCLRLLRVHQDKRERLPQDDILHGMELHGPRKLLALLALHGTGGPGQSDIATPFECSTCGICFCSTQALLAHEGKEHGIKHGRIQVFRVARDATEGTPVCRHCSHSFPTWTALRNHVEHAYCPLFVPLQVMSSSLKDIRTCLVPQIQLDDPDTISLDSPQRRLSQVPLHPLWHATDKISGHDSSYSTGAYCLGHGLHGPVPTLEWFYEIPVLFLSHDICQYSSLQGTPAADAPSCRDSSSCRPW